MRQNGKRVLESRFQTWFRRQLIEVGAMVLNVHGHAMQSPGWADLQVYHRIWTGHIELKMDPSVVKAGGLQDKRLRDLRDRHTKTCWISMQQFVAKQKNWTESGSIRLWTLEDEEWSPQSCPFRYQGSGDHQGITILEFLAEKVVL